ncbi:hypothetical protein GCM10023350_25560 [Nocardioides endophyticus]|uniref:Uncharacterized protein n=1 Tax=Nocardioides endophyticus TaxID=1353775 RepID=A0ABP8YX12_9ACTN
MRATTARRNAVKIFATVALVASAAAVAGIGTYGAYTGTTSADVSIGSAKVSVLMNDDDQGIHVDAKGMVPGGKVWETAYVVPKVGHVVQAVRATVVRYGAVWVALGGVVLLGLSLIWRQDPLRHRAPAPDARPRLTLITSEPRP